MGTSGEDAKGKWENIIKENQLIKALV